jgi:uncharacterized protein (TIGR00290 family)
MERARGVSWTLLTGTGKDATLALRRAREGGLSVTRSLTLVDAGSDRVRFHGAAAGLVEAHAWALGLEPRIVRTAGADIDEELTGALAALAVEGVDGVVFGNVHLADVRAWYEARTRAAGLEHVEPLWGEPPEALAREVVELGFHALITCVELATADPDWLGRPLDHALLDRMVARGVDPCGERGEYHTVVLDGPDFRAPVPALPADAPADHDGFRILATDVPAVPA